MPRAIVRLIEAVCLREMTRCEYIPESTVTSLRKQAQLALGKGF